MTRHLLEVRNLSKSYGGVSVLDDVSLTLAPGEVAAVLGPSGSGKTTLFRCIARLAEPDRGEVWIDGRPLHTAPRRELARLRRDIGVVFQQFNLIRRRSALDNVLAGRLRDAPLWRVVTRSFVASDVALALAALEAVQVAELAHRRADTLSGGQQQRVAIARAIAQQSRILIADEPVASLDPEAAAAVLGLLRQLADERGMAVLCSLHQPALAERYADRVLVMRAGAIAGRQSALRKQLQPSSRN